jgi:hypothetical protein
MEDWLRLNTAVDFPPEPRWRRIAMSKPAFGAAVIFAAGLGVHPVWAQTIIPLSESRQSAEWDRFLRKSSSLRIVANANHPIKGVVSLAADSSTLQAAIAEVAAEAIIAPAATELAASRFSRKKSHGNPASPRRVNPHPPKARVRCGDELACRSR